MNLSTVILLFCLFVTPTARSQESEMKGFRIGADIKESTRIGGFLCLPATGVPALNCVTGLPGLPNEIATIAGVQTRNIFISGYNGKIGSIRFTFMQANFAVVREAFESKYGKLNCVDSSVKNMMNSTFEQTICSTKSANVTLTLSRRGSDLKDGYVEIESEEYEKHEVERLKKNSQAAKKDI